MQVKLTLPDLIVTGQRYVVGFLFYHGRQVALIRKNKPAWQKGLLNGVGGKIEENETPREAMLREWTEETQTPPQDWVLFCQLMHDGNAIYFFKAATPTLLKFPRQPEGEEQVDWYRVFDAKNAVVPVIRNLKWHIPLALDSDIENAVIIDKSKT